MRPQAYMRNATGVGVGGWYRSPSIGSDFDFRIHDVKYAEGEETKNGWTVTKRWLRTFVIEAVDTVDAGTLVVAAEQEEVLGIFDLVGEQKTDRL